MNEQVVNNEQVTPIIGRKMIVTDNTGVASQYIAARLHDKVGKLKNGVSANYVVLVSVDNEATIVPLHPDYARRLLKNGHEGGIQMIEQPVEVKADPVTEQTVTEQTVTEQTVEAKEPAEPEVKGPSRKSKALEIFKRMSGSARKDVINAFISEVGMTKNGAATYYQNFKSGNWA